MGVEVGAKRDGSLSRHVSLKKYAPACIISNIQWGEPLVCFFFANMCNIDK